MTFGRVLLTTEEITLLTGIGRTQIFAAMASGALPSRIIGKRNRRILVADVEKWIGAPLNIARRASA